MGKFYYIKRTFWDKNLLIHRELLQILVAKCNIAVHFVHKRVFTFSSFESVPFLDSIGTA